MTAPNRGEAIVRVASGEYTLAFTLGACRAIEQETDKPIGEVLGAIVGNTTDLYLLQVLIWAGLRKHHNLTLDEVGDLVNMFEAKVWGTAITNAFAGAATEDKPDANPPKAKSGKV